MTFFFPGCVYGMLPLERALIKTMLVLFSEVISSLTPHTLTVSQLKNVQVLTIRTVYWFAVNMVLPF